MNAIGDATMALALFILIAHTSSVSYAVSFQARARFRRRRSI